MGVLTEYGKQLRHIRLDFSELLGTMAEKLKLSSAYLSSIETGNRNIPSELSSKVIKIYNLSDEDSKKLLKAEVDSNQSLTINLEGASDEEIDATVMFARELKRMSVKELREFAKKMKERKSN